MRAIYRVKDGDITVGFIIEGPIFYNSYRTRKNINEISNLTITQNGIIKAKKKLPEIQYSVVQNRLYKELVKENPFVRDIGNRLLAWKNNKLHGVLQLKGARQIGKTTELLKFGYKNYSHVVYVDLSNDVYGFVPAVINKGCTILDMDRYCKEANLPPYVNNKRTLLIIDEIQIDSTVYNSIRTLQRNLSCDIIVTGSYLGFTLQKQYFHPAGITYLTMSPLSFSEFCGVFKKEKLLKEIDLNGDSTDTDYNDLLHLYEVYRQIGGYPSVVKQYLHTKNIKESMNTIGALLETFAQESANYIEDINKSDVLRIVYQTIAIDMCNEKRGAGNDIINDIFKKVDDIRHIISKKEIKVAVSWLLNSGIISSANLYVEGDLFKELPSRRLYFSDCGMLSYILEKTAEPKSVIEGIITENFAYTELKHLYTDKKVKGSTPCFSTKDNYELDFVVIAEDNTVYGIEVKTAKGSTKSLHYFMNKKCVNKGIVAKKSKGGETNNIKTIPIFAIGCRFPYIN